MYNPNSNKVELHYKDKIFNVKTDKLSFPANINSFELDVCNTFQSSWDRGMFPHCVASPFIATTLNKSLLLYFAVHNVPHIFSGRKVRTAGSLVPALFYY
ncbi:hypothetical protein GOODEAATRI_014469 [Goodea atripinnis]|uniref:Uncharacterized protein n=1 Tax=Goodea atripinnis TaxID=208336 RepID=A0ABV0MIU1_9TELE